MEQTTEETEYAKVNEITVALTSYGYPLIATLGDSGASIRVYLRDKTSMSEDSIKQLHFWTCNLIGKA